MKPRWLKLAIATLVLLTAGFMVVDGTRALLVGDYFTIDGELGPWAPLVDAMGIGARSVAMKAFFVVFGLAWLVACALFLVDRASAGVMIGFAAASLWYLVIGTVFGLATLALLLVARRRARRPT